MERCSEHRAHSLGYCLDSCLSLGDPFLRGNVMPSCNIHSEAIRWLDKAVDEC